MKASAPGKLFLIGEYAVLENGPAALVPVNQRAMVDLSVSDDSLITAITTSTEDIPVPNGQTGLPLLDAVLDTLDCRDRLNQHHLTMNTSAFYRDGKKLGLGSSAALTAALVRLFDPDASRSQQLADAVAAHRRFQGGTGSGADIALSVFESPIRFTTNEEPETLGLPDRLHMLAIWTGTSASTVNYVARMLAWQKENPTSWQLHLDQLVKTAEQFFSGAANTDTNQILATIDQYGRQLSLLSNDSRVNFYTDVHVALQKKVESARCVYKPSGAGGGDFGIAFSADKNELITLAEEIERENRYAFFLTSLSTG